MMDGFSLLQGILSLIQTAAQAGYDISGMRPLIESLASRGR